MRSPVRLKLAEAIRSDLGEFAERWVKYIKARELIPDTDEPHDEAVNRARLGFEVLANLLEGADYEKFENVIRRLLHDWINRASTYAELLALELAFPDFLIPLVEVDSESDEAEGIRAVLDEFFHQEIRAGFLSDYLSVYENIVGTESHHTAYVLAHFDAVLALSAHLNAAGTRDEIVDGLARAMRVLFENVLGTVIWSETHEGLKMSSFMALDEEIPPAVIDSQLPPGFEEAFTIGEVRRLNNENLPQDYKDLLGAEPSQGLAGVTIPIRPNEADGLLVLLVIGEEKPGSLELCLCKIAAAECALALDRALGRTRITNVNRRIKDILLLSRETSWGSGYRETGELVLEYLTDLTGGHRALLLAGSPADTNQSAFHPLASRELTDDILNSYLVGEKQHPLITLTMKNGKVLLLTAERLQEVLAQRDPPAGFSPSAGEAFGILPLKRKGVAEGVCIFLCPKGFALEPESNDILSVFAGIAADNLATAREYERSLTAARAAAEDASRARVFQEQLTPRFRRSGDLVFWAHLHPAGDLAGDVTVVNVPDEGRLAIWTADVAGRGIAAGWSMMLTRQLLTDIARESISPAEGLNDINFRLHAVESGPDSGGMFTTAIGISLDQTSQTARFARAGAPLLFRICADGSVESYDPDGLPLGIFPSAELKEIELPIEPGDKLVWVSDGILNAEDEYGERWGIDRLGKSLIDAGFLPARALFEHILAALGESGISDDADDDRSLIVIGYDIPPDWCLHRPGGERDQLLDEALEYLAARRISQRDFSAIRHLLDEAIKNANEHGNKNDPEASIEVKITCAPTHVHLRVRDEGGRLNEGVTSPTLRAEQILEDKGRGFLLMRHQADHLWVEDERGELNAVRLLEKAR